MNKKNQDLLTVIAVEPIIEALNREGRRRKDTSNTLKLKILKGKFLKFFLLNFITSR